MDRRFSRNQDMQRTLEDASLAREAHRHAVPRWPAAVAFLAIAAAYWGVSENLAPVPRESILGLVVVGIVLILLARLRGRHLLVRVVAFSLIGVLTLAEATSTLLLVSILPRDTIPPEALLRDGAIIWGINVVTFALWYWEIDGGGPLMRRLRPYDDAGSTDFLFPQRALLGGEEEAGGEGGSKDSSSLKKAEHYWSPDFIDYLFLAFNHSTAFSPTDTAVLSRRAKVLVMVQASLSLMAIAVLISRAINAL